MGHLTRDSGTIGTVPLTFITSTDNGLSVDFKSSVVPVPSQFSCKFFASTPTGHPHSLISFWPTLNLSHFLTKITSFDRPVDASVTEKKVHLRMQLSIEPMAEVASPQS